MSLNDFKYLRAYSNILQHISDCRSPSNVKSLYCFSFCIWFCRLRNASLNLYLYVNHVEVEVQLRLWQKGRIFSSALQHSDMLNLRLFFGLLKADDSCLCYCCLFHSPTPSQHCSSFFQSMCGGFHLSSLNHSLFISVHLNLSRSHFH